MNKYGWLHALQIRPAHAGDGRQLARVLRPEDRAELAATHPGISPGKCLEKFIEVSAVSLFVCYRGKPLLLAGVYRDPVLVTPSIVWLLTGKEVRKHPIRFFKLTRFFLKQWLAYYGDLFNYVDARYWGACKLARRFGGELENDGSYYQGKLFLKCIFRRNLWEE